MRRPKFKWVRHAVSVERLMAELRVPREEALRIHAAGNSWAMCRVRVQPEASKRRRGRPDRQADAPAVAAARATAARICGE